jgi:hypothetical protein
MFILSHFDCFVLWCSLNDNMQVVFVKTETLLSTVFIVIHVVFQPHTSCKGKTYRQTTIALLKDCMTSEGCYLDSIVLPDLKTAKVVNL